jgi:MscS family membrane protein
LSVPAGILSQSSLENFATRDKILVQTMLRLRYGTTASQLQRVLSGVRALLDGHPDIEKSTARVRLVDFSVRAIEIEVFAYVLTRDAPKFLAVREELLLRIATLIESSGTGFYQEPPPQPTAATRAADGVT